MPHRPDALRLLTGLLPLDRVGPVLRRAARQAVAAGDAARQLRVARAVAGELVRRGDLIQVAIDGVPDDGALYALRGSTRLLDLAALSPHARTPLPAPEPLPATPVPVPAPGPRPAPVAGPGAHDGLPALLLAMEQAQALAMGEARGAHRQSVLEGILSLLARALPQRRLAALLAGEVDPALVPRRVAPLATGPGTPFWAAHRPAGGSIWFNSVAELPSPLRRALAGTGDRDFPGAAAVPLLAPPGEGERVEEAGLLLVSASHAVSRPRLLRDARLISHFVTTRWRQHLEMSQLVHSDSLTGVHNRAYFDEQLALEVERARRRESPLALVLADIDHFKRVNDTWGHPVGDGVLRTVARELLGGLRRIDLVCRIGGEEFALILPDTQPAAALEVCQRLLERIDRMRFNFPGAPSPQAVTLSYGGVTFPEGGTDPAELYRKADGMLYLSKRGGRNRCTFWNPRGEPHLLVPPAAPAD
ncbi:MAG: GGDEF domain-containing protein [Candidatus Krumholzibacteriia bacterium]